MVHNDKPVDESSISNGPQMRYCRAKEMEHSKALAATTPLSNLTVLRRRPEV